MRIMQSTFTIFSHQAFKYLPPVLAVGTELQLENNNWHSNTDNSTAICITSPAFEMYRNVVSRVQGNYYILDNAAEINNISIKDYADIPEYEDMLSFEEAVNQLIFAEVNLHKAENGIGFTVTKIYNTSALLQYWITQNTFTDTRLLQGIGLGEVIYNKVPPHHNYFGMCWVCTCGDEGCYNYKAWYIRFANSFSVGFILNYYNTIELNAKHSCFEEEDYEKYIADREEANTHKLRLQQIKDLLAADHTATVFYTLSEEEKNILKEGELRNFFPCVYEHEDFCLYQPLLNYNQSNLLLSSG
jgi:hypothetical protein